VGLCVCRRVLARAGQVVVTEREGTYQLIKLLSVLVKKQTPRGAAVRRGYSSECGAAKLQTNGWYYESTLGELKARDLGVPTADAVESRWARWRPSINPASVYEPGNGPLRWRKQFHRGRQSAARDKAECGWGGKLTTNARRRLDGAGRIDTWEPLLATAPAASRDANFGARQIVTRRQSTRVPACNRHADGRRLSVAGAAWGSGWRSIIVCVCVCCCQQPSGVHCCHTDSAAPRMPAMTCVEQLAANSSSGRLSPVRPWKA
jgi:hypothetical protein